MSKAGSANIAREAAAATGQPNGNASRFSLSQHKAIIIVLALTLLAFIGTLSYQFVYDDKGQIVENPFLGSWQYMPRYFTEHVWSHVHPNGTGNYYRPIFMLWLLINRTLFGLNPVWWHLATVVVHLCVTLLVYRLARRLMKNDLVAGIAALIFGLHPVHIEAVAWVSGVTEPLLAILLIPAFLFYLDWRDRQDAKTNPLDGQEAVVLPKQPTLRLVASLLLYGLAMLAKETALVLPMLIFGTEWISRANASQPFIQRVRRGLVRVLPYLALTVVYLVARTLVLRGLGHSLSHLPLSTVLLTWPAVLWFYLRQLIWPLRLSAFQDLDYVTSPGLWNFVLPAICVIAAAFGLWMFVRRTDAEARRTLLIASLWLVLPILPVLNISIFSDGEAVHDRYLYLPSIGFALIVGVAFRHLDLGRAKLFGRSAIQTAAVLFITLAFGFVTVNQQIYWASDLLLFQHGITFVPDSRIAKTGMANVLSERGLYDDAIALYKEVVARHPDYWVASHNLGCTLMNTGNYQEAETYLLHGIELRPTEPIQYITLSVTLQERQSLPEAERAARHAIELKPEGYGFHFQLGDVLKAQGNLRGALEEFKNEVAYNPNFARAHDQIVEVEARLAAGDSAAGVKIP